MGGAKADSQLHEGASTRVSLNQRVPGTEIWGTAALDQRRKRTQDYLGRIAPRRESWINHILITCAGILTRGVEPTSQRQSYVFSSKIAFLGRNYTWDSSPYACCLRQRQSWKPKFLGKYSLP